MKRPSCWWDTEFQPFPLEKKSSIAKKVNFWPPPFRLLNMQNVNIIDGGYYCKELGVRICPNRPRKFWERLQQWLPPLGVMRIPPSPLILNAGVSVLPHIWGLPDTGVTVLPYLKLIWCYLILQARTHGNRTHLQGNHAEGGNHCVGLQEVTTQICLTVTKPEFVSVKNTFSQVLKLLVR